MKVFQYIVLLLFVVTTYWISKRSAFPVHFISVGVSILLVTRLYDELIRHYQNAVKSIVSTLLISLLFILYFALTYLGSGLQDCANNSCVSASFYESVYFSIVTATTLGYGDFSPPNSIQLVAAIQAITGYIFLGLTIAAIISERKT